MECKSEETFIKGECPLTPMWLATPAGCDTSAKTLATVRPWLHVKFNIYKNVVKCFSVLFYM